MTSQVVDARRKREGCLGSGRKEATNNDNDCWATDKEETAQDVHKGNAGGELLSLSLSVSLAEKVKSFATQK